MRPIALPAALSLVLLAPMGCSHRVAPPAPRAKPTQAAKVALPSWAPKHPSKEFLRAAQVFKPVPEEAQAYSPLYVPAWELFGSLTDEQVKEFRIRKQLSYPVATMEKRLVDNLKERAQAKQVGDKLVWDYQSVRVEVPSFSPRQRAIFDSLRKAWQEANRGKPEEDLLVMLYRAGAKKDLSNVVVSFYVVGRDAVNLSIATTVPMGGIFMGEWVAQI